jgi:hypothetical protein
LEKCLGGIFMFGIDDAKAIIKALQVLVKDQKTDKLTLDVNLMKRGNPMFVVLFAWVGDVAEGRVWLDKIKDLGTVLMDMVSESMYSHNNLLVLVNLFSVLIVSIKQWMDKIAPLLPPPS